MAATQPRDPAVQAVIRTENLTKIYTDMLGREKVLALDGLNLEVHQGEIFGLLGPNGSGKTTTVKLLLGLLFPTEGHAWVLGQPTTDVDTKGRIGFLPEESYLYRFLNADETLDFYGQLFSLPRKIRRERTERLLRQVGLLHARKRPLREYSKGMSRRIGLAQALVNEPDLVILDEPTTGLDPIGTREMKDNLIMLREQGKTILLCSHLLADVQDICDRIAILNQGVLQVVGAVKDLLEKQDLWQVLMRGLDEAAIERLTQALSAEGEIVQVDHPTNTLEELFLRVVRQAEAGTDSPPAPPEDETSDS